MDWTTTFASRDIFLVDGLKFKAMIAKLVPLENCTAVKIFPANSISTLRTVDRTFCLMPIGTVAKL